MTATTSQKEITKYLTELVNDPFGSYWVPVWAAAHVQNAAAAIGLHASAGMYHQEAGDILLYLN